MAEMTNKRSRIKYISVLNAACCFAVVMLHSNGAFWTYSTDSYWISADFIESFMYFAVPVFFMISGTTLIDYRDKYSTREYFQKKNRKNTYSICCVERDRSVLPVLCRKTSYRLDS